jgi:dGTP triphosphohydrolase
MLQKYGFRVNSPDVSISQQLLGRPLPGDPTNMSRMMVDMGSAVDPVSGKPGNLTHDFLLKNFGTLKSWGTDPNIQLANEGKTEQHLSATRTHLSKNLSYHLENGDDGNAGRILTSVQSTFVRQYADNPAKAQEEFRKWLERRVNQIGRHPRLRNWNEDELLQRLNQASAFAGEARQKARTDMQKALQDQLIIRGATRRDSILKGNVPGLTKGFL